MPNIEENKRNKVSVFQMDSLDLIRIETDTSFLIGLAMQSRGCDLFFYEPKDLLIKNGKILAYGFFASIKMAPRGEHYKVIERCLLDLSDARVLMIRQDPPFDMNYITTTYILDMLPRSVLVLNHPASIRSFAEKISPMLFQDFLPGYILTANKNELLKFSVNFEKIVLKPLYQHGGKDIALLDTRAMDFELVVQEYLDKFGYVIVQEYIEDVMAHGDKRVLMLDGQILGFFRRVPVPGDFRSNTALGGSYEKCDLTAKEHEICNVVGQFLKEHEILFAGLDILNDRLIEINITSPTGVMILNKLHGVNFEEKIVDIIENKLMS
jgi:glutathione synthase